MAYWIERLMSSTVSDRNAVIRNVIASSRVETSRGICICNWNESSGKPAVNDVLFEPESSNMFRKGQGDKWLRQKLLKPKVSTEFAHLIGHRCQVNESRKQELMYMQTAFFF